MPAEMEEWEVEAPAAQALLVRLVEHSKSLYEEEKARTIRLNDAVKTYLTFLTVVVAIGLVKVLPVEQVLASLSRSESTGTAASPLSPLGVGLVAITIALFSTSLLCTMLVLKVWRFERPCDPEETLVRSISMSTENQLLTVIAADYAVAANRNHAINEAKARLLSVGLFSLMGSLVSFAATWMYLVLSRTLVGGVR